MQVSSAILVLRKSVIFNETKPPRGNPTFNNWQGILVLVGSRIPLRLSFSGTNTATKYTYADTNLERMVTIVGNLTATASVA